MPLELELVRSPAVDEGEPLALAAWRGAELERFAEAFYVRIFAVGCVVLLAGCGLALSIATLDRGAPAATTALFVALAAALAAMGLARPHESYRVLRSRGTLQVSPAALGSLAVLVDGPESACWWVALPLMWIVVALCPARRAMGAACATAAAFVAGTLLGGQTLLSGGDLGVLPGAAGLPAYTLVGIILTDALARHVLMGYHGELVVEDRPPPLRVPNLAAAPVAPAPPRAAPTSVPRRQRPTSRLTSRQLEIALLLRAGLRQTEIADRLAITTRQVERHLAAARERVDAETTTHLVAMLAAGRLSRRDDQAA